MGIVTHGTAMMARMMTTNLLTITTPQRKRALAPWHRLYADVKARTGKANPAKSAVARKVLIACWHVLSREEPFKPHRPHTDPAPASSRCFLAA